MISPIAVRLLLLGIFITGGTEPDSPAHVVNLVADHDSVFRVVDSRKAELNLIAGEPVLLRVKAQKAKSMNRDGSVHGLLLLDPRGKAIPGWDLLFKPGMQEMQLTAPTEPGIYKAVCTVICSANHDQMQLRVVVNPK